MFKHIMIPVDLEMTDFAERALTIAIAEARTHGADLHVELQLLETAGIPARDCLAGATVKSAEHFGLPGPQVLSVGGAADFLLVKGDAMESVAVLQNLVGVWKNGERVETE